MTDEEWVDHRAKVYASFGMKDDGCEMIPYIVERGSFGPYVTHRVSRKGIEHVREYLARPEVKASVERARALFGHSLEETHAMKLGANRFYA